MNYITDRPDITQSIVMASGMIVTSNGGLVERYVAQWDLKPKPVTDSGVRLHEPSEHPIILTPPAGQKLVQFQCWCQCPDLKARPRVLVFGLDGTVVGDTTGHLIYGNQTDVQPAAAHFPNGAGRVELTTVLEDGSVFNVGCFGHFSEAYA